MARKPNQYHGNRIANRARQTVARRSASGPVRLSQCMIVKNEERNIERALTWAKDIAFEQIVVDTGSTDRTVEIAESMGAKVFHFEWIGDFAAAKNYAIEKAKGNWIAFLDADEYFTEEHTTKMIATLREIQGAGERGRNIMILRCPLENVDDNGNVFSTVVQQRVFRNTPTARYTGKIHEYLIHGAEQVCYSDAIAILHTGYTESTLKETNKGSRNVALLRKELEENPDDINLKGYLADSLCACGPIPAYIDEALALYQEVVDSDKPLNSVVAHTSHSRLIQQAIRERKFDEVIRLCTHAIKLMESRPEFFYCYGLALYNLERYDEAWEQFTACENAISGKIFETTMNEAGLGDMFRAMALTAMNRNDVENSFQYVTVALTQNIYQEDMCASLLYVLRGINSSDDHAILDYLRQLYDFGDPRDKLFLAKCAKVAKDDVLMMLFYSMITPEEKQALAAG
jgi:glycosyltransferase involved in cell wall biosynthesis